MKNKLKILSLVALGSLIFTSCSKDPDLPMPVLQKTVIPKVTKDITKDANLSFLDLPGFSAAVIVDLYYDDTPKSMDLMVCMNREVENTGLIRSNITSFPTTTDFTLGTLIDALPGLDDIGQVKLGDEFMFYVDITLEDGTVIKGNDTLYSAFDPAVTNLPGSSLNVIYTVACAYDPAMAVGSYHSVSPPSEWNSEGNITITLDPDDDNTVFVSGLEAIEGLIEDGGPLVMHIDPATFEVTADPVIIASDAWGYGYIKYGGTGLYNSCDGSYAMDFEITLGAIGSLGNYKFTFTRN